MEINWHPVSDDPPGDKTRILIAAGSHVFIGWAGWSDGKRIFVGDSNVVVHGVKAWAELPQYPKDHGFS
jgi:hypothetical protein